jgi:hypothetical protein
VKTLSELRAEHARLKQQDIDIDSSALLRAVQISDEGLPDAILGIVGKDVVSSTAEWKMLAAAIKSYLPKGAKERGEADALYSSAMLRLGQEVVEDAE